MMRVTREALGLKCVVCIDDDRVAAAIAEVVAMERVVEAARERRCNRFDVTPCSDRPEINPDDWCSMCKALAALDELHAVTNPSSEAA